MGRKMATGTFDRKTGVVKREGLVKQEMMNDWKQKRTWCSAAAVWMSHRTATSAS